MKSEKELFVYRAPVVKTTIYVLALPLMAYVAPAALGCAAMTPRDVACDAKKIAVHHQDLGDSTSTSSAVAQYLVHGTSTAAPVSYYASRNELEKFLGITQKSS